MAFVVISGYWSPCRRQPQGSFAVWRRSPEPDLGGRLRRRCQHVHLASELGHEPYFQRSSRSGTGAPDRSGDGLSRGPRRRLSWAWRDLGAGLEFIGSSAAGQSREPAQSLLQITGIIPFSETIFLWQSMALCAILIVVSIAISWLSAPTKAHAVTANELGVDLQTAVSTLPPRERPSEWLEYSPLITRSFLSRSAPAGSGREFASTPAIPNIGSTRSPANL